mgnify:FL=1
MPNGHDRELYFKHVRKSLAKDMEKRGHLCAFAFAGLVFETAKGLPVKVGFTWLPVNNSNFVLQADISGMAHYGDGLADRLTEILTEH